MLRNLSNPKLLNNFSFSLSSPVTSVSVSGAGGMGIGIGTDLGDVGRDRDREFEIVETQTFDLKGTRRRFNIEQKAEKKGTTLWDENLRE